MLFFMQNETLFNQYKYNTTKSTYFVLFVERNLIFNLIQTVMRGVLFVLGLFATFRVFAQCGGVNLVTNGNFSAGNTGFSTSYTYSASSCYVEGQYSIASSGSAVHTAFCSTGDHTSGSGLYMIVNGAPSITNVWCQNMAVSINTWYRFSFWGMNVCASCGDSPQFSISINGTPASNPCATFVFNTTCSWKYYEVFWNSLGSTSANICITNLNTYAGGNDFALDDIEFRSCTTGGPCVAFALDVPVLNYAKLEYNQVQLGFWVDENLLHNNKVYIERNISHDTFEEIGFIQDLSTGTNIFTDKYPVFNQEIHYRIKSIDKNGAVRYSNIKSVVVKKQENENIHIYPNPASYQNNNIMLRYEGNTEQILSVLLTDMTGKVIFYQEKAGTFFENAQMRIPVQLSSGCYSMTIRFSDKTYTQKLLVY